MRLFVGIELPAQVTGVLVAAGDRIRREVPAWRGEKWVASHNLHVTLKFIDTADDTQLAGLVSAVGESVSGRRPFAIGLAGVRAVPNVRRCSMLWGAFDDPLGECAGLAAAVGCATSSLGFAEEARRFNAHATLVRARKPHAFPQTGSSRGDLVATTPRILMSVSSATLFSSTLTHAGPVYEVLHRWEMSEPS